jgi:hypothetical protein
VSGELPVMIHRVELVLRRKVEPAFEEEKRKEKRWSRDLEFMFIGDRMICLHRCFDFSCSTETLFLTELPRSSLFLSDGLEFRRQVCLLK